MLSLLKNTLLVSMFLTSFSPFAHASSEGPGGSGGGNAVGTQLLDFYENEGSIRFRVENTIQYQAVIAPLFAVLDQKVPGASKFLLEATKERLWYLEPKALDTAHCENSSLFHVKKQVVGCQNDFDIRLNQSWMGPIDRVVKTPNPRGADLENSAGLMIHEMVRYQGRKNGLSDEAVMAATRAVAYARTLSPKEIQKIFREAGLGLFPTQEDTAAAKDLMRPLAGELCKTADSSLTVANPLFHLMIQDPFVAIAKTQLLSTIDKTLKGGVLNASARSYCQAAEQVLAE